MAAGGIPGTCMYNIMCTHLCEYPLVATVGGKRRPVSLCSCALTLYQLETRFWGQKYLDLVWGGVRGLRRG